MRHGTRAVDSGPPLGFVSDRVRGWFGPACLAAAFAFMAAISWRKWTDVLVDFGRQLYIPWRLSLGETLYQDVYYVHGPLSPYVHAATFKLFGPGLIHLAVFNMVLIAVLGIILYLYVRKLSDAWTAFLAVLTFLLGFAFAHYLSRPNFNWVTPYVYDLTHGLFLGFLTLFLLQGFLEAPSVKRLAGVGFVLGLTFLTKMEVFLATGSAVGCGLILFWWTRRPSPRTIVLQSALVAGTAFIPFSLFLFYFSLKMPVGDALYYLTQTWTFLGNPLLQNFKYYAWLMGTDRLGLNLYLMGIVALWLIGIFLALFAVNHFLQKTGRNVLRWTLYAGMLLACGILLFRSSIPWMQLSRVLPLLLTASALYLLFELRGGSGLSPDRRSSYIGLVALIVFALASLLKVFFNTHFSHYGFALALPGTLVFVILASHILPCAAERISGNALAFRGMTLALVLVFLGMMSTFSYRGYQTKVFPVGEGADLMYDYSPELFDQEGRPFVRGMMIRFAVEYIDQIMDPDDTFLVLPSAIMLNYLSRHGASTPLTNFNSLIWVLQGDEPMLKALQKSPPDYIVFVEEKFTNFGYPYLGKDYGKVLHGWVMQHYEPVKTIGAEPFTGRGFGIQFLKWKPHGENSGRS